MMNMVFFLKRSMYLQNTLKKFQRKKEFRSNIFGNITHISEKRRVSKAIKRSTQQFF